jgi:LacI family transcriptional regulator
MAERVTMADVAREAGVSLMTVSRVVNHKGAVSPATRERVQAVIQNLNYRPSGIARSLATRRTRTLGLVVPDIANPFFATVARSVERQAYACGYSVLLCNSDEDSQRELAVLYSLEEKQVDGLIVCSSRLQDDALHQVVSRFDAVVLLNRHLPDHRLSMVLLDDMAGGHMATSFLVQCGHRKIGLLAGPQASFSSRCRVNGYHAALAEAGLTWSPGWRRHCAPVTDHGRQAALGLLNEHPQLTALFCFNDLVAVGALQACAQLGRTVPSQTAVIGFDDIELAAWVTPTLTTCRVPIQKMGEEALRLLLARFDGSVDGDSEVLLCPELVVRASAPAVFQAEADPGSATYPHHPIKEVRLGQRVDPIPT